MPGLEPSGVPLGLSGTAIPFKYNDIDDFKNALDSNKDIGVIVFEGARYSLPSADFLKTIEIESKKRGIVVIVDEITSGLRMSTSGVYSLLNFNPDIVVYGKGLGNGFAISAVVGRKEVMNSAQDTFISSSMWTERVGFVAGLATLNKLSQHNVHQHLIEVGEYIGKGWLELSKKHGLDISITDFKPLITFKLNYGEDNNAIATLFIQEMLKRGYLASTSVYITYSHTIEIAKQYLKEVDEVFEIIVKAIANQKILDLLETEIRSDMFKRLN
jgi:glutamate-1-semialdehyde aminotransferase